MRKLTTLFFVFALLGATYTQADAQTIGFKLGPTFSKLSVDNLEPGEPEPETLTSLGGGGFIRFGFAGLSLQAELLALTKGASQEFTDEEGSASAKLKLNYIEVPVTAMFKFGAPYVFAGPSLALEIGCEIELESDDLNFEEECDAEDDERKKTDLSLVGGAGIEFPMGVGRLLIEGRYIYGLTNLDDSSTDNNSVKHRTWAIFAGFAVPIGR